MGSKAFFRAVLLSMRYKWTIVAAIVNSLLIAVLWSASITTVYPLIEVVLHKQTIPSWVEVSIADGKANIDQLDQKVVDLEGELAEADESRRARIEADIHRAKSRIKAEQTQLDRFVWLQPYAKKYAPASAYQTLVVVMVWLLVMSMLKGACLVLNVVLVARIANRTVLDLRRMFYRKALELDQARIDQFGTSNLMTQLSYNMQMISAGLGMFYGKMMREPLKMLTCLIGAALISWKLLLISLLVIPLGAYVIHGVSTRMKRATQREVDGISAIFQTLIETFNAIKTVRIFNRERTERERFKRCSNVMYRMSLKISFYDSILRPITEMLGIVSIAMAILAGAYLVINEQTHLFGIQICAKPLSSSSLMLFYAMLAGASDPARKMSEIVNVLVRGGTACENLYSTFDQESKITVPEKPSRVPVHQSSIEFRNVTFAYQKRRNVLDCVNLTIPFGQTVAIVGGNGSGKTTLVNLLARFYDPNYGRIFVDEVDIKHCNPRKLRRQIAWVTQDSVLFRGTVAENILYGNHHADEKMMRDAAALAGVDGFIDRLANGYGTEVGDGGRRLSAGQRQRVALARAILADPKILILDEATSQMDGRTEQLVHQRLKEFLKQRTSLIITHRRSSLELADRVIVMDHGSIVSDNTVDDAATLCKEFQFLFAKSA